jgi:hypothetical protein
MMTLRTSPLGLRRVQYARNKKLVRRQPLINAQLFFIQLAWSVMIVTQRSISG